MRCRLLLFMSIATAVAILIVWFMPKRLTRQEIYNTWIVVAFITRTFDQLFALVFKLYDQLGPGVTWELLAIQTLFSGAMGVITLNYMPKNKLAFFAYAIGWTLLSVFIEWISIQVGYLVYKNWSLWYSACIYFLGIIFLRWHLSFLRKSS
jgi:hypothetical protein